MESGRPPRVALLGAGGMARMHATGWEQLGVEMLVHSPRTAAQFASRYRRAIACSTLDEALSKADFVDICTPTHTHEPIAMQALDVGISVLCEKPLTRTVAGAIGLAQHAAKSGGKLLPAHVVRWFADYEAAHHSVMAGDLGQLTHCRYTRTGLRPEAAWYHEEEQSGGIILDLMIHDLDQALWNCGPVAQVRASCLPPSPTRVEGVWITLDHSNGAVSTIEGNWGPPGTKFHTTFELTGSEGVLDHDSRSHRQGRLDERAAQSSSKGQPHVVSINPYHHMLADFLAWHQGGPTPPVSVADGIAAVRLGNLAIESVHQGRAVSAV